MIDPFRFLQRNFFVTVLAVPGLLFLLVSCKTSKKIVADTPLKLKGADVIEVFDSVYAHQFNFEWLSLKAAVQYTAGEETESFDVALRIRRDSAIWISFTPLLGIEALRILVSQDSIQVLNRIQKTYHDFDFEYLDSALKTRLNFEIMQAVIIGNYFPYMKNEKLKSVYEEDSTTILSTLNKRKLRRAMEDKDPNKPIVQDFWINGNYRITKSRMEDDRQDRSLEASYSEFTEVASGLLPNKIEVNIRSAKTTSIQVDFSSITANEPVNLPFSVPEKYERK